MSFRTSKFMKEKFSVRTERVSVPLLKDWFDEGEKPEWEVRNLTGRELALSQEARSKAKSMNSALEAIVQDTGSEKLEALRKVMGISLDNPDELVKRLDMLVFGSISPRVTLDVAVKLAENFPFDFMKITSKIIVLTGLGASTVKPPPSGKTEQ